jgi:hypothetical protein
MKTFNPKAQRREAAQDFILLCAFASLRLCVGK